MNVSRALLELLEHYSPSGREEGVARVVERLASEAGYSQVRVDATGNVIAEAGSGRPSVLLCGHMDTVAGFIEPRVDGDRIFGRGAVDAKSPLLALLLGGAMAHRSGFPGKVVFAGAVGEESRSKGIYSISRELQATDFAVFGEPSNTKDITVGYKGRLLVSVSVDTEAHHASAPWLGRNAVDVVYDILGRLRGEFGNGSQFRDTSCSVTRLSAGTAHNVTPSSARMLLDLRFPPSVTAAEAMERLRGVLGGDGSLRVRKLSSVEAYVSDMKSPLVASFRRAIESVTGSRPSLLFKSGSGDMNILGRLWGIPCITYGPGDPQMSHTRLEWVSAGDVEKAASVTAEALLGLGNVSRGD